MNKVTKIILMLFFLCSCSQHEEKINIDEINIDETILLEESENEIVIDFIIDYPEMVEYPGFYHFNYLICTENEMENFNLDSGIAFSGETLYLSITLDDQNQLTFTYPHFPYVNGTFIERIFNYDLNEIYNSVFDSNSNGQWVMKRLIDHNRLRLSELLENKQTLIGEIYNINTGKTIFITIVLYEIQAA